MEGGKVDGKIVYYVTGFIILSVILLYVVSYFQTRKKESGYKASLPPTRVNNRCQDCFDKFRQSLKGDPTMQPFCSKPFVEARLNLMQNCINTGQWPLGM